MHQACCWVRKAPRLLVCKERKKHSTLSINLQGQTRLSTLFMMRLLLRDIITNITSSRRGIHCFLSTFRRPIGHDCAWNRQRVQRPQQNTLYRIPSFKMGYEKSHHSSVSHCSCGCYRGYNYLVNDVGYALENITSRETLLARISPWRWRGIFSRTNCPIFHLLAALFSFVPGQTWAFRISNQALPHCPRSTPSKDDLGTSYYSIRSCLGPDNLSAASSDPISHHLRWTYPNPASRTFRGHW